MILSVPRRLRGQDFRAYIVGDKRKITKDKVTDLPGQIGLDKYSDGTSSSFDSEVQMLKW